MNNGQDFGGPGLNYNPGNGMMTQGGNMNMNQQPQPMYDPNTGQPVGGPMPPQAPAGGAMNPTAKKAVMLIPAVLIGIIVIVLLFNLIFTKTVTCKYSYTDDDDIKHSEYSKEKYRFGAPVSSYAKTVVDYSKADVDKDDVKDKAKDAKDTLKKICKKKDGCSYSVKQSGKKITVVMKKKYDKDEKEDFKDEVDDFKEYIQDEKDSCKETKERIEEMYD